MKNIINYRYTELILFFSLPFYLFFFFFLPKRSNSSDIKTHTAILQANVILAIKTALKNNLAIHRSLLYHVLYDIIELEYHRQENHGKKKKKKKKKIEFANSTYKKLFRNVRCVSYSIYELHGCGG